MACTLMPLQGSLAESTGSRPTSKAMPRTPCEPMLLFRLYERPAPSPTFPPLPPAPSNVHPAPFPFLSSPFHMISTTNRKPRAQGSLYINPFGSPLKSATVGGKNQNLFQVMCLKEIILAFLKACFYFLA